ncbi:MAG: cysteine desulfurase [Anaerolineales bacterium]|nr:cysteine desulfurase [Anaerolineales bacterium]
MTTKISPIYLDYNATTPCDPRVVEKMLPYFYETYGNPSNGLHIQGRKSAKAIDVAREQIADLIGARSNEIVFTSGATESNNLAILGLARFRQNAQRKRIVTCVIEHKAILLPCKKLKEEGFDVVFLPVDKNGRVVLEEARNSIDDNTLLVSIQGANNEIGTLQPIKELAELAHQHGALFHSDAAQAVGKVPVSVDDWEVDLLSLSAHKFYGPKGVGALYIRGGTGAIPLEPIGYGGGQESGLRSGTTNVPSIVGLGEASKLTKSTLNDEAVRVLEIRNQIESQITSRIPLSKINGVLADRLPNTTSITFQDVDADALIYNAPDIMIGTGSACTSGAIEPSHVLTALGLSREDASSTIRISLGRYNREDEIHTITESVVHAWSNVVKKQ